MNDLTHLIERCESGAGWDEALNAETAQALGVEPLALSSMPPHKYPRLVDSLDAVISLIEQKLPGWTWGVSTEPDIHGKAWHASVSRDGFSWKLKRPMFFSAEYIPGGPARALLAAFLKAYATKEGVSDGR